VATLTRAVARRQRGLYAAVKLAIFPLWYPRRAPRTAKYPRTRNREVNHRRRRRKRRTRGKEGIGGIRVHEGGVARLEKPRSRKSGIAVKYDKTG